MTEKRKKRNVQMLFAVLLFCCAACLYPVQTKAVQLKRNENYIYCDSSEYDGIEILEYRGEGGSVTVPEEIEGKPVRVIGKYAFKWKAAFIKDVRLPDTVSLIKESAFAGCSMERIKLPLNLCKFERFALAGCDNLQTIDLPQSLTELSDSLFESSGLVQIVIPENITCINSGAFMLCHNLERVVFAEGSKLNTIGQEAFSQCMRLKELELPDSLQIIEGSAFSMDIGLKKVTFGKKSKLKELGGCFDECISLTEITIPKGVRKIDTGTFDECKKLKRITFTGKAPELSLHVFRNINKKAVFWVPAKYKTKYKKALNAKTGFRAKTMKLRTI